MVEAKHNALKSQTLSEKFALNVFFIALDNFNNFYCT